MPYLPAETYDDPEELKKGIHDAQTISRRAFEPMRKIQWPRAYQLWNKMRRRNKINIVTA